MFSLGRHVAGINGNDILYDLKNVHQEMNKHFFVTNETELFENVMVLHDLFPFENFLWY
jgi:hypothetical protein